MAVTNILPAAFTNGNGIDANKALHGTSLFALTVSADVMPQWQMSRRMLRIVSLTAFFLLIQAACLFGPAGSFHWPMAWAFLAVYLAILVLLRKIDIA